MFICIIGSVCEIAIKKMLNLSGIVWYEDTKLSKRDLLDPPLI